MSISPGQVRIVRHYTVVCGCCEAVAEGVVNHPPSVWLVLEGQGWRLTTGKCGVYGWMCPDCIPGGLRWTILDLRRGKQGGKESD